MFHAKSMYNGGIIIAADEVNYSDYKILGLRCLECGEEVCLKKGIKKLPHFAHFKELINSPKDCSLRVIGYSDSEVWSQLTPQGRKQRRKLFQQFFLKMLASSHEGFEYKVDKLREIDRELKFINIYLNSFKYLKKDLIRECLQISSQSSDGNSNLQILILQEVTDYLCLPYTSHLLEQVIYYAIYQENNFSFDFLINQTNVHNICYKTQNILLNTNWLSALSSYANQEKIKVDIEATQLKHQANKDYRLNIKDGLSIHFKNNVSRRSNIFDLGIIYKNIRFCLEDNLEIILLQEISRKNNTITRRIPTARITQYSINNDKKGIFIEINWEFINENLLTKDKIDYFLFYDRLKTLVEDFLHCKFKNNISVKFILIPNQRFQEAKAFFDETQEIKKREEEKTQQQLKDREEKSNQVSRALEKFLNEIDEINYSRENIDDYIQNIIQEFGSDFMIKCPRCDKNKLEKLKAKNLLKHLNKVHQLVLVKQD